METEETPEHTTPYQRRKQRERELRAAWREENRQLIDALGGDTEADRIVRALAHATVRTLDDLRAAHAGTFDYSTMHPQHRLLPGEPVDEIRGIGPLAMERIKQALQD